MTWEVYIIMCTSNQLSHHHTRMNLTIMLPNIQLKFFTLRSLVTNYEEKLMMVNQEISAHIIWFPEREEEMQNAYRGIGNVNSQERIKGVIYNNTQIKE